MIKDKSAQIWFFKNIFKSVQYISYKGWYEERNLFPKNLISPKLFSKYIILSTHTTHTYHKASRTLPHTLPNV